ncbi:MAG: hypothetical protein A2033_00225 [Bacteroidetes bacterium GWA2_31_9]|nr:MAG: hypothetical protein A2033_00225 [Bacteroidetes bacterium GWA2_31_9]
MKFLKPLVIIIIFLNTLSLFAQELKVDSLIQSLNISKNDSDKIRTMLKIGLYYEGLKADSIVFYYKNAINLCNKNIKDSINCNVKSYKKLLAKSFNLLAIEYAKEDKYSLSIENYQNALRIYEKLEINDEISECLAGLGTVNCYLGNSEKALEFFEEACKTKIEISDSIGLARCYYWIGNIYYDLNKYNLSLEYYNKTLILSEKTGSKKGVSVCLNNIGNILYVTEKYEEALEYYQKSLEIKEQMNDIKGIATTNICIGMTKTILGKPAESIKYHQKALETGKEIYSLNIVSDAYRSLSEAYEALEKPTDALEYFKLFKKINDSIYNSESSRQINEMQTKYETEKKEQQIIIQNVQLEKKDAENKKQRTIMLSFIFGFIIILIFSILLYRLFLQKKRANTLLAKQNVEISQQKEEIQSQRDEIEAQRDVVVKQKEHIEEIHLEVTDSINYAKRIQEAVLPVSIQSRSVLGEHFILFRPKDIVSGDFYWVAKIENTLIVAVADCTGHGVPGAFMSMLGISFLNEIVRKKEITKANEVLNQLRKEIINALQQKGQMGEQKDGMDISLVAINTQAQSSKSQVPNPKFQEEESEKVRQGESKQSAVNDEELQSSEMFIEKESDNNKDLSSKSQNPSPKLQEEESKQYSVSSKQSSVGNTQTTIKESRFATSTSNLEPQTSNVFNAQWAGANNPLWIVRSDETLTGFKTLSEFSEGASANNEQRTTTELASSTKLNHKLFELKPDKMPIAIYERMDDFTNHELQLQKGDILYLMSDGYQDQFGGLKFKKFLSKNLKQLLVANSELPMEQQRQILETTLVEWIGDGEQIDDVTLVGIRI